MGTGRPAAFHLPGPPAVHAAGRGGHAAHGVHDDGQIQASPCVNQPGGLPVRDDDPDTRQVLPFDLGSNRRTYSIIAAVTIAYPDDHCPDGAPGRRPLRADHLAHRRRTLRVRKWAAQEMHGS